MKKGKRVVFQTRDVECHSDLIGTLYKTFTQGEEFEVTFPNNNSREGHCLVDGTLYRNRDIKAISNRVSNEQK